MKLTKEVIRKWIGRAKKHNAQFLIVMCDTFDYTHYPVECVSNEDFSDKVKTQNSMQKIMEVYDMSMDIERQLMEDLAYNIPR